MHVIDQLGRCLATSPQPRASGSTKRIVKIELLWITAYRLTRVTRLVVKGKWSRYMNARPGAQRRWCLMLIDIHSTDSRLAVAPRQDSRLCSTLHSAFLPSRWSASGHTISVCSAGPKLVISCPEAQIRHVLLHLLQDALDELVGLERIRGWNCR
jgi:hypothetical protein